MRLRFAVLLATSALSSAAPARADDDSVICADRPTRAANACTVPAGRFQYEADVVAGVFQKQHGVTTDSWSVINPTLKYGVADTTDVELQFDPLAVQRVHTAGGKDRTAVGPGDLFLRLKQNLFGGSDGAVQVAVVPYIKAPTASHLIGNGAWEGGGYAPVNFKLGKAWTLALTPELDLVRNDRDGGRHLDHSEVVSLSRSLPGDWTVSTDLYARWDFQRHGATQSTLDFAVAKVLHKRLQFDAGVNLGLNRATPGANAYLGVSQRF